MPSPAIEAFTEIHTDVLELRFVIGQNDRLYLRLENGVVERGYVQGTNLLRVETFAPGTLEAYAGTRELLRAWGIERALCGSSDVASSHAPQPHGEFLASEVPALPLVYDVPDKVDARAVA